MNEITHLDLKPDMTPKQYAAVGVAIAATDRDLPWVIGGYIVFGYETWHKQAPAILETVFPHMSHKRIAKLKNLYERFPPEHRAQLMAKGKRVDEILAPAMFEEVVSLPADEDKLADRVLIKAATEGWDRDELRRQVADIRRAITIGARDEQIEEARRAAREAFEKRFAETRATIVDRFNSLPDDVDEMTITRSEAGTLVEKWT